MPYRQTEYLLKLIERLSPAEKRHFRLYTRRNSAKGDILFMQLFDQLDKSLEYNEPEILKKIKGLKRGQVSNLKANLYKQILASLRSSKRSANSSINIRENIDYATILHEKGLYNASLDLLDKTKRQAQESEALSSILNILEIEKHIEGLYITGSMYPKAKQLRAESILTLERLQLNHQLSNLSLSLYGLYLQYGYVKDDRDFDFVHDYFKDHLPILRWQELDFYGGLYYNMSHVWYYNMIQDFPNCYKYAQRWVDLFQEDTKWLANEMSLYIKGMHNVLNALFMAQRYDKFEPVYRQLVEFGDKHLEDMNRDQLSNFRLIEYTHGINQYFLTGAFDEGVKYVKKIEISLVENSFDWDLNRIILFNYKIASIYFCYGDLDHTITLLNRNTNDVYPNFREDIQCFSRILNLIAHFDLGNESLVKHQIRSTYRFLSKMEHLQKALKDILGFLRRIPKIAEEDLKSEFQSLKSKLEATQKDRFERRPFLYLDINSWLESKILEIPVADVMRQRIAKRNQSK